MPITLPADASAELKAALEASVAAADIARRYYRSNLAVETKADRTPVTQADLECEQAIRAIILEAFPEDGFFGEETGTTGADADRLWLVDPIDGTKGFVREYPLFSTQIALMEAGRIRLGVSNGIMFEEIAWAERGKGAWLNDDRLAVSRIDDPADMALSTGNLHSLAAASGWAALGALVSRANRIRGYGDFFHYHLLAAGKIEAVVESDVNILDIAALSILVEEAGGRFTDLDGQAIGLETRSVLAANPALHETLLDAFRGWQSGAGG